MTVNRMLLQPCSWSTMQYSMVCHLPWKHLKSRQVHHAKLHPVFQVQRVKGISVPCHCHIAAGNLCKLDRHLHEAPMPAMLR